jgi:hypothetical protein
MGIAYSRGKGDGTYMYSRRHNFIITILSIALTVALFYVIAELFVQDPIYDAKKLFGLLSVSGALGALVFAIIAPTTANDGRGNQLRLKIEQLEWASADGAGVNLGFVANMAAGSVLALGSYFLLAPALHIQQSGSQASLFGVLFIGVASGLSSDIVIQGLRKILHDKFSDLEKTQDFLIRQRDIESRISLARQYMDAGDFDRAEEIATAARSVDHSSTEPLMALAEIKEERALRLKKAKRPKDHIARADALLKEAAELGQKAAKGASKDPYRTAAKSLEETVAGRLEYVAQFETHRSSPNIAQMQQLLDEAVRTYPSIVETITRHASPGGPFADYRGAPWFARYLYRDPQAEGGQE